MEREIIFRGKRIDNGEWVHGDMIRHYENQRIFIAMDELSYESTICGIKRLSTENYFEVVRNTISQFTGKYDCNSRMIFEDDIVKTKKGKIQTVEWYETASAFVCFEINSDVPKLLEFSDEIIGNCFDNTELLEVVNYWR